MLLVFLLIRAFAPDPKHDFIYLVPSTIAHPEFTNSKTGKKPVYENGSPVAYQHYYATEQGKLVRVPIYSYDSGSYDYNDYRDYGDYNPFSINNTNTTTTQITSTPVKEPQNGYRFYRYDVSEKKNTEISFEQAQKLWLKPLSYHDSYGNYYTTSYSYHRSSSPESPDGFILRCDRESPDSVFDDYYSSDCSQLLLSGNNKKVSVELLNNGTRNNKGFIFIGWIVSSQPTEDSSCNPQVEICNPLNGLNE